MELTMNTIKWNTKFLTVIFIGIIIMSIIYFTIPISRLFSFGLGNNGVGDTRLKHLAVAGASAANRIKMRSFELKSDAFYINGEKTRILSGAVHYFRVVPEYWLDRLTKLRAAGLNTVETYVPWNRHEEIRGQFNFQGILNVRRFITLAHELGLYVILRPGPYICSEWEFGGLPSWLLRDEQMKVRSSYKPFLSAVDRYFNELFRQIVDLQFHYSGPIIMMQIENEYGSFGSDTEYLIQLKEIMESHGVIEKLFVSENLGGLKKMELPGVLKMANFKKVSGAKTAFSYLKDTQPGMPLMVMEFWSGWFDQWGGRHNIFSTKEFTQSLEFILSEGSSVNVYMFHGGTNFGFMNGRNGNRPDVTSYDYDAPLTQAGDITPKYHIIRELIVKHQLNKTALPDLPSNTPKAGYGVLNVNQVLHWTDILSTVQAVESNHLVTMEMINYNNGSGQGYGFIVYRHSIARGKELKITGHLNDRAQILINGVEVQTLDHIDKVLTITLKDTDLKEHNILDIIVENTGRINWGSGNIFNEQRKGLDGVIKVDDVELNSWKIYPLDFKPEFLQSVSRSGGWKTFEGISTAPALYEAILKVDSMPEDTFLNMKRWHKGVVFINGFNLGRYWHIGPTRTLYVPAPLLKSGENKIFVFELHAPHHQIVSTDTPVLS